MNVDKTETLLVPAETTIQSTVRYLRSRLQIESRITRSYAMCRSKLLKILHLKNCRSHLCCCPAYSAIAKLVPENVYIIVNCSNQRTVSMQPNCNGYIKVQFTESLPVLGHFAIITKTAYLDEVIGDFCEFMSPWQR